MTSCVSRNSKGRLELLVSAAAQFNPTFQPTLVFVQLPLFVAPRRPGQRLEAGNFVEQFLVSGANDEVFPSAPPTTNTAFPTSRSWRATTGHRRFPGLWARYRVTCSLLSFQATRSRSLAFPHYAVRHARGGEMRLHGTRDAFPAQTRDARPRPVRATGPPTAGLVTLRPRRVVACPAFRSLKNVHGSPDTV